MPIRQYAQTLPGTPVVPMGDPVAPTPIVNTNTGGVKYDKFEPITLTTAPAPTPASITTVYNTIKPSTISSVHIYPEEQPMLMSLPVGEVNTNGLLAPPAYQNTKQPFYTPAGQGGGGSGNVDQWATYPAVNDVDGNGFKIVNVADPTNNQDVATKAYVDASITVDASLWANYKAVANVDMSSNKITNTANPTNAQDVATKNYVDTQGFITDASDWSLYPAIATVDVAEQNIENVNYIVPGLTNQVIVATVDGSYTATLEVQKVNDGDKPALMSLYHDTKTPAVNDGVGTIIMDANNTSSLRETFGAIETKIQSATAGSEKGLMNLQVAVSSTLTTMMQLDGSANQVVMQKELNMNDQDLRYVNEIVAEPLSGNRYGLAITTPQSLGFTNASVIIEGGANRTDISNNGVNLTLRKVITSGSTAETVGQINFAGRNSANANYNGGYIGYTSQKNTAGTETGYMFLGTSRNGTVAPMVYLDGSNNYIDATTHRIVNVVNPVNAQDVATKNYVDVATSNVPNLSQVLASGNTAGYDIDFQNLTGTVNTSYLTNASGEMNISADDLNLSTTGLTSVLNLSSVAGITATAGGAVALQAGGVASLTAVGLVNIGSSTDNTEIEKVRFADNAISKATGASDLTLSNVGSIRNTANNIISMTSATTTITSTAGGRANPTLELTSTNTDAPGTYLQFYHNSATPDVGDRVGVMDFYANNASAVKKEYARMRTLQNTITAGTEQGEIEWSVIANGSMTNYMSMDGVEGGVVINPEKNILSTSALKVYDSGGVATNNTMMYVDVSNIKTMFKNYPQRFLYENAGDYTVVFPDPGWNLIRVLMTGGGAGGGSGRLDSAGTCYGGGAGSGGNVVECWYDRKELFPDASGALTLYITVGAGGAGGNAQAVNAQNGNNGSNGGQTTVSITSIGGTSGTLYYQVLGGNGGSGGTNSTGAGGNAPSWGGGNFGFAGRPGASSSITAQPGANTTGSANYCGTICQPPGGSGAGGGINVGGTTAYNGGSMASPAGQYYGVPGGAGLGLQNLVVGTAGTAVVPATGGAGFTFASPVSSASIRPLRGNVDGFSGGGGSIHPTTGGGNGGGHTAGQPGSRGSGGAGGGASLNVSSGAGGRGRDGFVYITLF